MPISQFLDGQRFDPETKRLMGLAFEITRAALGLTDGNDPVVELVAKKIIELAKAGERDPDILSQRLLQEFRAHRL